MSTPRPQRKTEQREASLEKLREAALGLFVGQGYRATTLDQVAAAAGLTKGAVYFYFGSKGALLVDLMERVERCVVDDMLRAVAAGPGSAPQRMVSFLHHQAQLGVTRRNEVLLLVLMSLEFHGRSDEPAEAIARVYRRLYAFVEALVADGQANHEFRRDVPAKELAAIVVANHDGTFLEWHRRSSVLDGRSLVRALRSVVLDGLRIPGSPAAKSPLPRAEKSPLPPAGEG